MPDNTPDTTTVIPEQYADYKAIQEASTFKSPKADFQKEFLDPKSATPAGKFTIEAAKSVTDAFVNSVSLPVEQHAASEAFNISAPTAMHTTQARKPLIPENIPPPDIMKADLPAKIDLPKEEVDIPTKEGGIEALLPAGDNIKVNPSEAQVKDIEARNKEIQGVKSWSDIVNTKQYIGTIVKTDKLFNTESLAWKKRLQMDNPTWTGEYVYLDMNDKGHMVPKAYNPSMTFKTAQGANVGNLPDVTVSALSKQPSSITDEQANEFVKQTENDPWQTQALLKDNLPLAKFLMQHPDIMEAVKKSAEQMPSNMLASQTGKSQILQQAIADTYGNEKTVPTDVLQAVQSYNYYNAFKTKYQSEQQAISAKMKMVGENAMKGVIPEMDEMLSLEVKKLNDPASMTEDDIRRYAKIKMDVTNAVTQSGSKELPDLWNAYQFNQQSFISASKQVSDDLKPLGTREGQDGLNLYLAQKKGEQLLGAVPGLFPDVMKAKQAQISEQESKYANEQQAKKGGVEGAVGQAKELGRGVKDFGKSIYTGMVGGVDDVALGVGGMFGSHSRYYTAKFLSNGGSFADTPFAQTALNEAGYKPFYAQAGEMLGNMAPAILMGQFAKAPELGYFMLGTYNQGYQHAKLAGASELQAQTIGGIKGGLIGLFMHTMQMPSDLAKATVGRITTEDLLATGFTKKSLTDYFMKLMPTEQGVKGVALLNAQNLAQEASSFVINAGSNKLFGTHLATNQLDPNNIAHDVMMNTVVGGMISAAAKLMPEAKGARMEILRNFNENPALYASILEEARKNALAGGDYKTLDALNKAHEFIANSWAKESKLPKGITPEQKTAALSIWDEIAQQEKIKHETDKVFHEPIQAKIEELHKQLKEVVASPEKAAKMVEKETTPIQQHLEETVLRPIEEIKPEQPHEIEGGVAKRDTSKERTSKISKKDFTEQFLHFAEDSKDSSFDYRLTLDDMSQKEREGAVADIRAGKTNTKRAQRLQAHIDRMWENEHVSVNRGRGNQAQSYDVPFKDWFGEHTPEELDKEFSQLTPEQQSIAEQDYETEQQLTDEYWKQHAETNGFGQKEDNTKTEQDARAAEKEAKLSQIEKDIASAPEEEKPYHEQRKQLVERYGKDVDELIDDLKKEDRLKVDCPPTAKKRFSLRNLFKRN